MAKASKIALDTNLLFGIETLKINPFEEIRRELGSVSFVVPETVHQEIARHTNTKSARVARLVLDAEQPKTVKTRAKNADDSLLELAEQGFMVATNDRALRKKLHENGLKSIIVKKQVVEIR